MQIPHIFQGRFFSMHHQFTQCLYLSKCYGLFNGFVVWNCLLKNKCTVLVLTDAVLLFLQFNIEVTDI